MVAGAAGRIFAGMGGLLRESMATDRNKPDIPRAPKAAAASSPNAGRIDFFDIRVNPLHQPVRG
jgi:hypothetical protein